MYKYLFIILFMLIANLSFAQDLEPSLMRQGSSPVFIAIEYGLETKGQEDINSIGLKLDFAKYHRDKFGTSIEGKIRWYRGIRTDVENNTLSFGLGYAIKYHFLNIDIMSVFVDCGLGAAYALDPFPSKGTNLNGQYYLGIGILPVLRKLQPIVTIRYYHSSNGSGGGIGNPAYDGIFFSTGIYL